VSSVFGRIGDISPQNGDYTGSQITNVPAGNLAATTVQTALNELDSEKADAATTTTALAGKAATTHNHDLTYEAKNANIQTHIATTGNPHGLTKTDLSLGNVENTTDAGKPISTATQTALDGKAATAHNHTGVYKAAGADETANVAAASDTVAGKSELATIAETSAGTDTGRTVTPDGLAGSVFGVRVVEIMLNAGTALATTDKAYFRIPACMNGMKLISVAGHNGTASSSGNPTFTVKNGATSMLSTNLTIDATEADSSTAATAAVIDTASAHDVVATGNWVEVACSGAGTGTLYAVVELGFQLP
jgi:hypothetical protein